MRFFRLLFLLLLPFGAGAQASIDSLQQRLATTPPDTNRVLLLNHLCWQTSTHNVAQALAYGQQGLTLARQLRFGLGEVYLLNALARAAFLQHDELAAIRYYQQAVRRAEATPRADRQLMLALLGLSRVAIQQQDFAEGEKYGRLALAHLQRHRPVSLTDQGLSQYSLASLYYGWLRSGQPAPDSIDRLCTTYTRRTLATFRRLPPDTNLASCFADMGKVHALHRQYDSAEYCFHESLRLYQRFGDRFGQTETRLGLAEVLLARHRPAEAEALLRPAVAWARQLKATGLEAQGDQLLAAALAETGQGLAAYRLAHTGQALLDSLQSAERRETLARLRVQFDTERQQSRVRELTQRTRHQQQQAARQRQYLWLLGGLLLAVAGGLGVAGLLAWRLRLSRALLANQNAELQATRTEQDRLYALIAHDLRSPVVAFTALADLLKRYVERHDTVRLLGLGERMRQAAEGLRGLLDNLLSWALTQRGELTPQPEPLAAAALLAEAAELYQPGAEAGGVQLLVAPEAAGHLLADRNMTHTILRNLISNALRATPPGGTITLDARASQPGQLVLSVRDTGTGMDAGQVQRLLAEAPLALPAGRRSPTGLGWRLSQSFARAQGGQLGLESAPGRGTTVMLKLPAAGSVAVGMKVPHLAGEAV
ncbi:HAMP domain-containing sensor histidine kinase [Hymenobacter sp. M29]|uniref:histidine kinase n=1 Tax=Hymenobacter mellowenesis TaxID=3063995 RepID=A0ABT9A541_9BACT|nr:HAMP domain-containing sensor histidine kinase [Hymenobacter sp. M29]MDO7844966.1 HAMP domain-containing sensor histidine kinase [Hymenobacter sp. M29]